MSLQGKSNKRLHLYVCVSPEAFKELALQKPVETEILDSLVRMFPEEGHLVFYLLKVVPKHR